MNNFCGKYAHKHNYNYGYSKHSKKKLNTCINNISVTSWKKHASVPMAIFKRNPKGLLNSGKIHRYKPPEISMMTG